MRSTAAALSLVASFLVPKAASAQSTEEKFQDLFVTAGYCTAFGAALGAATLAFAKYPTEELRNVAMGASLGFLGGSVLGSYIIFAPAFGSVNDPAGGSLLADGQSLPPGRIVLRPSFDPKRGGVTSVESGVSLLQF